MFVGSDLYLCWNRQKVYSLTELRDRHIHTTHTHITPIHMYKCMHYRHTEHIQHLILTDT